MTDKEVLGELKKILGSLYDPEKEDMYLRVVKRIEKDHFSLMKEPLIPKVFEGIDWGVVRIVEALSRRVGSTIFTSAS